MRMHSSATVSHDSSHDSTQCCFALWKVWVWENDNCTPTWHMWLTKQPVISGIGASSANTERAIVPIPLFCTTRRGKKACDRIGGLVKQQVMLYTPRANPESAIHAANDMVTVYQRNWKMCISYIQKKKKLLTTEKGRADDSVCLPRHSILACMAAVQVINRITL